MWKLIKKTHLVCFGHCLPSDPGSFTHDSIVQSFLRGKNNGARAVDTLVSLVDVIQSHDFDRMIQIGVHVLQSLHKLAQEFHQSALGALSFCWMAENGRLIHATQICLM